MLDEVELESEYVQVAHRSDLPTGALIQVEVDGEKRILAHTENGVRALDGLCTHEAADLVGGDLEDGLVWCPFHASGFDADSGQPTCPPAIRPLRTYDVQVRGEAIFVAKVATSRNQPSGGEE